MVTEDKRTIVIRDRALLDSKDAFFTAVSLIPTMLYPENSDERELYTLGFIHNRIQLTRSIESVVWFQKNYPELSADIYYRGNNALEKIKSARASRKGLTGNLAIRSNLAGYLLFLISKYGDLQKALDEYESSDGLLQRGEPIVASTSLLTKCFTEYRNISPLLAAKFAYLDKYDNYLFRDPISFNPPPETPNHLLMLLRLASFFRNVLLEVKHSGNETYLVKDIAKVWNFERENGDSFDAVKIQF